MNINYKTFKQVQSALINLYDQKYLWVLPEYEIDFDIKTVLPAILKQVKTGKMQTIRFYDAFALKYNLDKNFANTLDSALEAVRTYNDVAAIVQTLYTSLCTEEQIILNEKPTKKFSVMNERHKEIREVRDLISQTDELKNHLNSVLSGIDYYYNKPNLSDDDTPEVMELIEKGLDIKTELQTLVSKSRAKINLIKFKTNYNHKFKADLNGLN